MSLKIRSSVLVPLFIMVALIGFSGGLVTGASTRATNSGVWPALVAGLHLGSDPSLPVLNKVWTSIHSSFVQTNVDDQKLVQGAIAGLVSGLGDPYSVYFTPSEAKSFSQEISGTFDGIGMELGYKNNQLTVIAPLPGSPAEKAGISSGDVLLKIDQRDATVMKLDEAIGFIRGPKGTIVVLTIQRAQEEKPRVVSVTRQTISVPSVTTKMLTNGTAKIADLKISSFNNDTGDSFLRLVQQDLAQHPAGWVIDLRNNPGGYLDQAVIVASAFIRSGTIVSEIGRDGQRRNLEAKGDHVLADAHMVALVDQGSASASEILAGALQDTGRATIIGTKTFGKGSVQEYQELADGSSLKLTVAKWYTPKGRSISDAGVTPDLVVERTPDDVAHDRDPQLDKALAQLARQP
ncbi:MAG: S41 family peptidase [Candidatus Kerfeldbacteria bacterium]|nr:S41 family peptidase [Candidatus Kerfeldbacteria bacterium]